MHLIPTGSFVIPSSPLSVGWDSQNLVVEKHTFAAKQRSGRSLVFLFSHGTGFHKEMYHPLIRHLINYMRSQNIYDTVDIHVFAWDARLHGESAIVNKQKCHDQYRWEDNALDTKQVIDYFDLKKNYDALIGVGHSLGGCCMVLLERLYPNTFDSLCLIDPPLLTKLTTIEETLKLSFYKTKFRRDEWSNKDEVLAYLSKKPFWMKFDPEVLNNYTNYGMYITEQGSVKLKCPMDHEFEVLMCLALEGYATFEAIKNLTLPTNIVLASYSPLDNESINKAIKNICSKYVSTDMIEATHQIPFEIPSALIPYIIKAVQNIQFKKSHSYSSRL
ncbi:Alpha/Beta hydrolase protein [Sporodiniella umbellata]|nr:Alpha/Beta hydrolase protein [Sporodiniella umbellata]